MNGKGDPPRPMSVSTETYHENFERTFGKMPRQDTDLLYESYHKVVGTENFATQYPGLSGIWEQDKLRWELIQTRLELAKIRGEV